MTRLIRWSMTVLAVAGLLFWAGTCNRRNWTEVHRQADQGYRLIIAVKVDIETETAPWFSSANPFIMPYLTQAEAQSMNFQGRLVLIQEPRRGNDPAFIHQPMSVAHRYPLGWYMVDEECYRNLQIGDEVHVDMITDDTARVTSGNAPQDRRSWVIKKIPISGW